MIRLGPGGSPMPSTLEGVKRLDELGLNALEVEFTHGVRMKHDTASEIRKSAEKYDIALSVHAPYYINLNSAEKPKIYASMQRIIKSCELGEIMGAKYVVFHAAYYGKKTKEETYEEIRLRVSEMMDKLKEKKWNIELAPESMGKISQFGDVDELLRLSKHTGCHFTIDFSHLFARYQGKVDYGAVLEQLKHVKHIHSHFSGIQFGEKGERRHEIMSEEFFMPLAREIKKRKPDITIISESPITWKDSLKMKKVLESIKVL